MTRRSIMSIVSMAAIGVICLGLSVAAQEDSIEVTAPVSELGFDAGATNARSSSEVTRTAFEVAREELKRKRDELLVRKAELKRKAERFNSGSDTAERELATHKLEQELNGVEFSLATIEEQIAAVRQNSAARAVVGAPAMRSVPVRAVFGESSRTLNTSGSLDPYAQSERARGLRGADHARDAARLAEQIRAATNALGSADDDEERASAKRDLRAALEKYFDADMEKRAEELKEIAERLHRLEQQLDRRSQRKEEVISLQLQVAENEANGLGFYRSAGGHGGELFGSPFHTLELYPAQSSADAVFGPPRATGSAPKPASDVPR